MISPPIIYPPDLTRWGVYVHVPFCDRVCPYCDFAVTANRRHDHMQYADALCTEWSERKGEGLTAQPTTLYFGGGTPSMFQHDALARVFAGFESSFELRVLDEVTLESNPQDITDEALSCWASLGVTRLSLGCQSFQDRMLSRLGRNHDGQGAIDAVRRILSDGRFELSIDLIYGGPEQDAALWEADLEQVSRFDGLNHVSAYQLTIEPQTPFARQHRRGELTIASETLQVEMLASLRARLSQMGMSQYEVSSFARSGYEAKHNSSYWLGVPYVGLGVGAHSLSFINGQPTRLNNPRQIKHYLTDRERHRNVEALDAWTHLFERLFVNVRTTIGVDLETVQAQFQEALPDPKLWAGLTDVFVRFVDQSLMTRLSLTRFAPTPKGLLFGDWMAQQLDLWLADCQGS